MKGRVLGWRVTAVESVIETGEPGAGAGAGGSIPIRIEVRGERVRAGLAGPRGAAPGERLDTTPKGTARYVRRGAVRTARG